LIEQRQRSELRKREIKTLIDWAIDHERPGVEQDQQLYEALTAVLE
jgi:hypothetical protein